MGAVLAVGCIVGVCYYCKLCRFTAGRVVGIGHIVVVATIFAISSTINKFMMQWLLNISWLQLDDNCHEDFLDACAKYHITYRASFACSLYFLVMLILAPLSHRIHESYWVAKNLGTFAFFLLLMLISNGFFSGFAEFTRLTSLMWMIMQSLLIIDFGYDLHDYMVYKAESAESNGSYTEAVRWKMTYMLLSIGCQLLSYIGLGLMFAYCSGAVVSKLFICITGIYGIFTMGASVAAQINQGYFVPSFLLSYNVIFCWYVLMSAPEEKANPEANVPYGYMKVFSQLCILAYLTMAITWSCWHGPLCFNMFWPALDLQPLTNKEDIFDDIGSVNNHLPSGSETLDRPQNGESRSDPNGTTSSGSNASVSLSINRTPEEEMKATEQAGTGSPGNDPPQNARGASGLTGGFDIPPEIESVPRRIVFHTLLMFACLFCAMCLTNWASTSGVPENMTKKIARVSMWIKATAQWITMLVHVYIIYMGYMEHRGVDPDTIGSRRGYGKMIEDY